MTLKYIDLAERHGHRGDHGFDCGAEFDVKMHGRRVHIPDFVREQLSESQIDDMWWTEAQRSRDSLRDALQRRYKWIGELAFVGRGPGWLAIEDTGCRTRNWDTIGKIVEKYFKAFVASMEDPSFWTEVANVEPPSARRAAHATKKSPAQLDREIAEALAGSESSTAFEQAKAERDEIERESDEADAVLKTFPRGPMGLTPDSVRATPEWKAAKARSERAFARLRAFNTVFVRRFAKEIRAEQAARTRERESRYVRR